MKRDIFLEKIISFRKYFLSSESAAFRIRGVRYFESIQIAKMLFVSSDVPSLQV